MAAAVADYRPAEVLAGKRGKGTGGWTLELEPTTDVLRTLGQRDNGPLLVGFAAESGGGIDRARQKLTDKKANLLVYNDVSRGDIGFDSEENEVTLIGRDGEQRVVEKAPKRAVAGAILDEVARLLEEADGRGR